MQNEEKAEVDEGLYSRQLYIFGHDAQKRMASTSVLIVGIGGFGVELAKNIILAGVKAVGLFDDSHVQLNDLGSQFYLSDADIGKPRAQSCLSQLVSLNQYVSVRAESGDLMGLLKSRKYQVLVTTDKPLSEQMKLNALCRSLDIKFIAGNVRGLLFSAFVDNGENHVVTDDSGEQPLRGLLSHCSQASPCVVTMHEEVRHGLSDGMFVTFEEIQGMTELNALPNPVQVKVLTPYSFSIDLDTTAFQAFSGTKGYFNEVKVAQPFKAAPLSEQLLHDPVYAGEDIYGVFPSLHCLSMALSALEDARSLPRPDDLKGAEQAVALADSIAQKVKNGAGAVDKTSKSLIGLARCATAVIAPMCALAGGILGQEVLKACTGKFVPIKQFLYFADADALPLLKELEVRGKAADADKMNDDNTSSSSINGGYVVEDLADFSPAQSRYDDYLACFGKQIHAQMTNTNYFLVGSGAIGCEMLKNWALMGVATGAASSSLVHVTDMDTIEKSNLNRQFLFRPADVGKLKSEAAAQAVAKMNPAMRIKAAALRVSAETEEVYDDAFWDRTDAVITALDNVDARMYIDTRCIYYRKPLVDSGTLGIKGNTQVVIPFLSESYGSGARDPPEESIPSCTLKNFPNKIEHTIQWAREHFEDQFKLGATEANNYLSLPTYLEELAKTPNTQLASLQSVLAGLVTEKPLSFDQCIMWARCRFEEDYNVNIGNLLSTFPVDAVTNEGTPFWSGPKRAPTILHFDQTDPMHMDFVVAAANLRAFNYGLKGHQDAGGFAQVLASEAMARLLETKMTGKRKAAIKVATTEAEAKELEEKKGASMMDDYDEELAAVTKALPSPKALAGYVLNPVQFEKDDDANFHMQFITACSNLRARCYSIKEESRHHTKLIAGKIIPAMATTTALVTGLVCLEMYKLLMKKPLEAYRNTFVSLGVNVFAASNPASPETVKTLIKGKEWAFSLWDTIFVEKGDITLQDFLDYFTEEMGLTLTMINHGRKMIYYDFGMGIAKKLKDRLTMPMSKVCETVNNNEPLSSKLKYLTFEISAQDENGEDVEVPAVRFKFR